jgi:plastocyanin
MIASSLRAIAVPVALVLAVAACASPGSSSAWSFGPSLAPAEPSGSAAASAPPASVAPSTAPSAPASATASTPPTGEVTNLTIGTKTGDELEFDPDEVSVPAGAQVKLTFENRASLPHNLTFKAPMTAATAPIVAPGESATVDFTAPEPGTYQFGCTIHPTMRGTLTVEPVG